MSDLISRKALIAEYDRVHVGAPGGARKLMEDAPAVDSVQVVRCKKCIHRILPEDTKFGYGFMKGCVWCKMSEGWRPEDGFCHLGKSGDGHG